MGMSANVNATFTSFKADICIIFAVFSVHYNNYAVIMEIDKNFNYLLAV